MKLDTTFKFVIDNNQPAFAGYATGSLTAGEPFVFLNLKAMIEATSETEDKIAELKDSILATATHEFCHAMQEWLGKEFSEEEVDKILTAYNEKWAVLGPDQPDLTAEDPATFCVMEFLHILTEVRILTDSPEIEEGVQLLKDRIHELFGPLTAWFAAASNSAASSSPPKPFTRKQKAMAFAEWMDYKAVRNGPNQWKYVDGDKHISYTTEEMYDFFEAPYGDTPVTS